MILTHLRANAVSLAMTSVSGVSALTAWQEHLDWGFRIIASIIAILAGMTALHDWLKRHKK